MKESYNWAIMIGYGLHGLVSSLTRGLWLFAFLNLIGVLILFWVWSAAKSGESA